MVHLTIVRLVDENVSETNTMTLENVEIDSCLSHAVSSGALARVEQVVLERFNELTTELEVVEQTHAASVAMRDAAQEAVLLETKEKEENEAILRETTDENEIREFEELIELSNQFIASNRQTVETAIEDVDRYAARLAQLRQAVSSLDNRGPASYKVTIHAGIVHVVYEDSALVNNFDDAIIKELGEEAVDLNVSVDIYEAIQDTVEEYLPCAAPAA
ncbi:hypothetical protein EV183_004984 [Coemansia sp. RSA 2336]|nr:hypothetical protein EV183_004984 [Coemansia sp. RSA 2336]